MESLTQTEMEAMSLEELKAAYNQTLEELELVKASLADADDALAEWAKNDTAKTYDANAPLGDQSVARITSALMGMPEDSALRKSLFAFFDSLIENYKDGPGAPGRAAYNIACAVADSSDTAYSNVTVTERTQATAMGNMVKGFFK